MPRCGRLGEFDNRFENRLPSVGAGDVAARAEAEQLCGCRLGRPRRLVAAKVRQQPGVRGDLRPMGRQFEGAFETAPHGVLACFICWLLSLYWRGRRESALLDRLRRSSAAKVRWSQLGNAGRAKQLPERTRAGLEGEEHGWRHHRRAAQSSLRSFIRGIGLGRSCGRFLKSIEPIIPVVDERAPLTTADRSIIRSRRCGSRRRLPPITSAENQRSSR